MFIAYNNKKRKQNFVERRLPLPKREENEMFAVVTLMTGSTYIKAMCEDGVERAVRIPGKLRNRIFIKENDVIIVKKRDYEDGKADAVWRFLGYQSQKLKAKGYLNKLPL